MRKIEWEPLYLQQHLLVLNPLLITLLHLHLKLHKPVVAEIEISLEGIRIARIGQIRIAGIRTVDNKRHKIELLI